MDFSKWNLEAADDLMEKMRAIREILDEVDAREMVAEVIKEGCRLAEEEYKPFSYFSDYDKPVLVIELPLTYSDAGPSWQVDIDQMVDDLIEFYEEDFEEQATLERMRNTLRRMADKIDKAISK